MWYIGHLSAAVAHTGLDFLQHKIVLSSTQKVLAFVGQVDIPDRPVAWLNPVVSWFLFTAWPGWSKDRQNRGETPAKKLRRPIANLP